MNASAESDLTDSDLANTVDAHVDPVVAAAYDSSTATEFQSGTIQATVDLLAELAGDGSALEFAVGTGRIALPLAERGVAVNGIDVSLPMLEQLRAKPNAERVQTVVGDMASTVVGDDFAVAYLVYNTIMNLLTQDAQVACFENAARQLRPGGRFVIQTMVPALHNLGPGERYRPFHVSSHHVGIEEYVDPVKQISRSHHYHINGDRVRTSSPPFRYVWPSELDLMARIAGMTLEHRWADWTRTPFTGESPSHVSVWRKPVTGES